MPFPLFDRRASRARRGAPAAAGARGALCSLRRIRPTRTSLVRAAAPRLFPPSVRRPCVQAAYAVFLTMPRSLFVAGFDKYTTTHSKQRDSSRGGHGSMSASAGGGGGDGGGSGRTRVDFDRGR